MTTDFDAKALTDEDRGPCVSLVLPAHWFGPSGAFDASKIREGEEYRVLRVGEHSFELRSVFKPLGTR